MDRLKKYINADFPMHKSIVLRYHSALNPGSLLFKDLEGTSLGEGVKIFRLCQYRGVDIFLMDETTLMHSGTYKSIGSCITIALCKKHSYRKIVFSSGANTGIALTLYAKQAGIETFFFHPENTAYKIDGTLFSNGLAHRIAVGCPERIVKSLAQSFSDLFKIPLVPKIDWRIRSSRYRAFPICEVMQTRKLRFSWIAQTICAGYGPLGMYQVFKQLREERIFASHEIPQFLGIQQKANAPMVTAWNSGRKRLCKIRNGAAHHNLIEPALYNTFPQATYPKMCALLRDFGGSLLSISEDEYNKYCDYFVSRLSAAGIQLTIALRNGKNDFIEKAGILAGIGILKAIDEGRIKKGEKVLCCFTGGIAPRGTVFSEQQDGRGEKELTKREVRSSMERM